MIQGYCRVIIEDSVFYFLYTHVKKNAFISGKALILVTKIYLDYLNAK